MSIPPQIKVINKVPYLGIENSTSVSGLVEVNYSLILKKIEEDINRWKLLPTSVPARIAVIKMNILPRVNFISLMILLAPPIGYWQKTPYFKFLSGMVNDLG